MLTGGQTCPIRRVTKTTEKPHRRDPPLTLCWCWHLHAICTQHEPHYMYETGSPRSDIDHPHNQLLADFHAPDSLAYVRPPFAYVRPPRKFHRWFSEVTEKHARPAIDLVCHSFGRLHQRPENHLLRIFELAREMSTPRTLFIAPQH